jgi:hypothetical protein
MEQERKWNVGTFESSDFELPNIDASARSITGRPVGFGIKVVFPWFRTLWD